MATPLVSRVADAFLQREADAAAMRSSYLIPEIRGTEPNVDPEGTDLAIWTYEHGGRLMGVAFQGNQSKPIWHYRFRSEAERDRQVQGTIAARKRAIESKAEAVKKRREFRHSIQVGDIYYTSWGYDQTNVDFYQVIDVREKSITVREVEKKTVVDQGPHTEVVPVPNDWKGAPQTRVPSPSGGFKADGHYASKWDGRPKHETGWGYGH